MDIEECKSAYEGLKKNAFIVESIDKEFFLKFGETVLNELDKKDKENAILRQGLEENTQEIDKKDKIINEMGEHIEKGCDFDSTIQTKKQIIDYFTKKVSEK